MAQAVIRARTDLDASGFNKGISSMQASATKLKGYVAGAFSVGAIAGFAKAALSAGGDIADLSDNLGVTTDQLQALQYGFRNAGAEAGTVEQLLAKLKSASATAALEGSASEAAKSFDALGISLAEVSDLSEAEKLERISAAWVKSGESAAIYADVIKLIGKQGIKTQNAMRMFGGMGMSALIAEATEAGNVASEQAIRAADKREDFLQNKLKAAQVLAIGAVGAGGDAIEEKLPGGKKQSEIDAAMRAAAETKEDEKEAAKIRLETEEKIEEHRRKNLEDSERLAEVWADLVKLEETVLSYDSSETDAAKLEAKKAAAKIELDDLRKSIEEDEKKEREKNKPNFDALRRIGGRLAGGMSQDPRNEMKKMIKTADAQLAELQTISRKLGTGASF